MPNFLFKKESLIKKSNISLYSIYHMWLTERSYFLLVFLLLEVLADLCTESLANLLFILEALFLWIACFFVALSAIEEALEISLMLLDFLATRTAISRAEIIFLLISSFLLDPFKALLAVLVTGIIFSIHSTLVAEYNLNCFKRQSSIIWLDIFPKPTSLVINY